jgi:hypothetical protein
LLLKQTLEASYDPGPLLLNGPNVRLTSAEQLLSKMAGKANADSFLIRLEMDGVQSLTITFKKLEGIELFEMAYRGQQDSIILRPGMSHEELTLVIPKGLAGFPESLSNSTLAIFLETRDRGKRPPDKAFMYRGIGCQVIS